MAEENINYITEIESLKKDIRELEKKNKKLVDIQNTQGDLFKMIIHDLKGPVGEITANLDLLNCDKSLS
jgi:two-component system sensor histidine kinase KdpD